MPDYLPENAGVSYSKGYAEAIASATIGDPILQTFEFRHPEFVDENGDATSYWIVNNIRNLVATDENSETHTYLAIPLEFVPPEQSDTGAPKPGGLKIDNVSREITRLLMLARESDIPVEAVERRYLPSDTSAPHVLPVTVYELANPEVNVESATVQLTFGHLTNKKFPARIYTVEEFPGLVA
jgi:hypothetical protein